MADGFEFLALFLVLCYCAWQLNEIRRISRACYVELSTARWEKGRSVRAKDQLQGLSTVGRETKNLTK